MPITMLVMVCSNPEKDDYSRVEFMFKFEAKCIYICHYSRYFQNRLHNTDPKNQDLGYGTFCQVIADYYQSLPSIIGYDLDIIFLMGHSGPCKKQIRPNTECG
jgi:hypothetical protein